MSTNNNNNNENEIKKTRFITNEMMRVVCKDNVTVEVPLIAAKMSVVFQNFLQSLDETGGSDIIPEMNLPNIENSRVLVKIIAFCLHYQCVEPMYDIPKPVPPSLHDCVQKWYADYVEMKDEDDTSPLIELAHVANYLAIQPLITLVCAKLASLVRGKTPNEIRTLFNVVVPNDDDD